MHLRPAVLVVVVTLVPIGLAAPASAAPPGTALAGRAAQEECDPWPWSDDSAPAEPCPQPFIEPEPAPEPPPQQYEPIVPPPPMTVFAERPELPELPEMPERPEPFTAPVPALPPSDLPPVVVPHIPDDDKSLLFGGDDRDSDSLYGPLAGIGALVTAAAVAAAVWRRPRPA